jgi:hypothetical protein
LVNETIMNNKSFWHTSQAIGVLLFSDCPGTRWVPGLEKAITVVDEVKTRDGAVARIRSAG